ncbi:MAG: hypothetical protein JRN20_16190 [Nitrososphaerota archaeon]|nr:hypothetical protein [Nitrososphaerota archaeon]
MIHRSVVRWLLEEEQPSVRYLTLTQLLDRLENDPEVEKAKSQIAERGWAKEILSKQSREGWWISGESLYQPKYISTNWMLLVLSDLGLTRDNQQIAKACRLWIRRFAKKDGGFGTDGSKSSYLCVVGNTARALVKFGYADHPKVKRAFEWMVKNQSRLGGWSCYLGGRNLDSWEPMSAFAVYPREKWSRSMKLAVDRAAEFFLERELHKQGDHYEPWYRFHYPVHYYYDLLVGLDFMTELGYGSDRRMSHAIEMLNKKMRSDGRWLLDAVHPDVEGGMKDWYKRHPYKVPTPFALEQVGRPSKMITFRALDVLKRIEEKSKELACSLDKESKSKTR